MFEHLWTVAGFLISAGAVYGGIRGDLAAIHQRIAALEKAVARAHERMDDCADRRGNHERRVRHD
jgi:hypothetical protein